MIITLCVATRYSANVNNGKEINMDYHCNMCDHDLFLEEGYNEDIDDIVCPYCKAVRGHVDYFIKEV